MKSCMTEGNFQGTCEKTALSEPQLILSTQKATLWMTASRGGNPKLHPRCSESGKEKKKANNTGLEGRK